MIPISIPIEIDKPVLVTEPNSVVSGSDGSRHGRQVLVRHEGPCVLVCPAPGSWYPYPQAQGEWLRIPEDLSTWFDLRDCAGWDLNGLLTLTVEASVKQDILRGAPRHIVSSRGREFFGEVPTNYLRFDVLDGCVRFGLRTVNGWSECQTPVALQAGVEAHVSCVYDGAALRVYIDGTERVGVPLTGAVVMPPWANCYLGGLADDSYGLGFQEGGLGGWVKDLRLSGAVLRPGPFDPATYIPNRVGDRWRLLVGSQPLHGPCVPYYSRDVSGWGWLVARSKEYGLAGAGQTRIDVRELHFTGNVHKTAVMGIGAVDIRVERVRCDGGRYGIHLHNNCYNATIVDCDLSGGQHARAGIVNAGASGCNTIRDVRLYGHPYGIYIGTGSLIVIGAYILPSYCGIGGMSSDEGVILNVRDSWIAHENTSGQDIVTMSNVGVFSWSGGGIETRRDGVPFRFAPRPDGADSLIDLSGLHVKVYGVQPIATGVPVDLSRCRIVRIS